MEFPDIKLKLEIGVNDVACNTGAGLAAVPRVVLEVGLGWAGLAVSIP
jgi:hypothetical protein